MKWFRDEKAVSPVIGVILMVAITVILAAVIASFVFGLGSKAPKSAPQAQLVVTKAVNGSTETIYIEHRGGEAITVSDLKIIVTNETAGDTIEPNAGNITVNVTPDNYFEVGETLRINTTEDLGKAGDTINVKVIHIPSNQPILDTRVQLVRE